MVCLRLKDIFNYCECDVNSRNYNEGESVLMANHVIVVGEEEIRTVEDEIKIYSLVLQTSNLNGPPHEIQGSICRKTLSVKKFTCSCKAGAGGKCKHVTAVLLYLNRNDLMQLEKISCTDVKCLWRGEKKSASQQMYKPTPIEKFCCIESVEDIRNKYRAKMTPELKEEFRRKFMEAGPVSAFSRYMSVEDKVKSGQLQKTSNRSQTPSPWVDIILKENDLMLWLSTVEVDPLEECCRRTYNAKFKCHSSEEIYNAQQNSVLWHQFRQYRITGSRCYSLYTAANNNKTDWQKKSNQYFWPKSFFENKYIKQGRLGEKLCRPIYEEEECRTKGYSLVSDGGLIVSSHNPWLGYSPDGIVFRGNSVEKLLEIKTAGEGGANSIDAVLPKCKFLKLENKKYLLRRKHKHYGQVTLGMVMTGTKKCDFVTFAPYDHSMAIEEIDLDIDFAVRLLGSLKKTFFNKMLHSICLSENNNI